MKLLTWNLNGLDDTFVDERAEAAVFLSLTGATLDQLGHGATPRQPPDVIVLQELTRRTFSAHISPHFRRAGFTIYPDNPPERELFEIIAVRQPWKIVSGTTVALERSLYGRQLQSVVVDIGPERDHVQFLTAHFDSGTEEGPIRLVQAHQVATAMTHRSVFAGDTNLRTSEWDFAKDRLGQLTDAWEQVGSPPELRRTWTMADRGARFDRVWLGPGCVAKEMSSVGTQVLPGLGTAPSDHIGLLTDIDIDIDIDMQNNIEMTE
jgi:endonuclease/exonuclease/phosphatase family metal-dependent hydrolase